MKALTFLQYDVYIHVRKHAKDIKWAKTAFVNWAVYLRHTGNMTSTTKSVLDDLPYVSLDKNGYELAKIIQHVHTHFPHILDNPPLDVV